MGPAEHPSGQIPAPNEKWTETNPTNLREATLQFEQAQKTLGHAFDMSTAPHYPQEPPTPHGPASPTNTFTSLRSGQAKAPAILT